MATSRPIAPIVVAGLGFGAALGVAAGALVLAPNMPTAGGDGPVREEFQNTVRANQVLQAQNSSGDAVVGSLAPLVVDGTLAQRPVLVIATAEADRRDVDAVRELLRSADCDQAGFIKLEEPFFEQNNADKLLSIFSSTLPAGAQLDPKARDVGTHGGQALGAALLLDPDSTQPLASTDDRANILTALRDGGYLSYEEGTIRPAQAAVVIGGKGSEGYFSQVLSSFTAQLKKAGGAAVLAGRIELASDGGAIGKLRGGEDKVSTVDSLDRASSRLATVMAVAEQIDGKVGAYGAAASANSATPELPKEL